MYFGSHSYDARDHFYFKYNGSVILNYDNDFCYILKIKAKHRNHMMPDKILWF